MPYHQVAYIGATHNPLGHVTSVGVLGIVGCIAAVLVIMTWIFMVIRASRNPTQSGARGQGTKRGDNTGGVVAGSPAQVNRRDEAPRQE
ncbi:hypothetical protein [Actinoallomurus soli]|uniref:hypothetical protein n=1 Tax=Actinoallomurus soli TaxID=2952535 RepID=UPI002093A07F|nr:hypothetical protein [Actinoallomurus soli]MCO5970809.1 hypothetical protein [Actinoallomurus soli]